MSVQSLERTPAVKINLNVVLCGSFRRDLPGLASVHETLRATFNLLSPAALAFVDPTADFVRLEHELTDQVADIEDRHLAALMDADFIWLHAARGYVGRSASMEIGHARAWGVPVFTDVQLADETLNSYVNRVGSPLDVPAALAASPGRGLASLQRYYSRISSRRGWDGETPQDTLLLMTEEMGELARAVRKRAGLRRDSGYPVAAVAEELADVQLYLVHLANALGVDISEAVTAKETINAKRFAEGSTGATDSNAA